VLQQQTTKVLSEVQPSLGVRAEEVQNPHLNLSDAVTR